MTRAHAAGSRRPEMLGLVLLALAAPGAWIDPVLFSASWLTAWWYVIGLMLGAMTQAWMHRLTGGRWGVVVRPVAVRAARRLPLALLLGAPVAAGASRLYPWAGEPHGWAASIARPAFVLAWLQPGLVAARIAVCGAVWWWITRERSTATGARSALALALGLLAGTIASVDLLMSLVPGWYSTAFGLVVLAGQALGGAALATFVLALRAPAALAAPSAGASRTANVPLARDLGNLLLMWIATWAYLAFMEFLVVWAENLPAEIAWYLPRLGSGWAAVGEALAVGQLAVPLVLLLQRRIKDRPRGLAAIAALLLATQLLNTAWLVLPSVRADAALGWWLVPQLALGMGVLLFYGPLREGADSPAHENRDARN